jgi:raffinose synthase
MMLGAILPARAQLSVGADHGSLQVRTSSGAVISSIGLRVRLATREISAPLEPSSDDHGSDAAGEYELHRYRFATATGEPVKATLELRLYTKPEVLIAALDYEGEPPSAQNGVTIAMQLNEFARGLALHRLKLWWLAPTFISDPRLLSGANQLLLWQRMGESKYDLLVPLAGDGMVGELGVSDFDHVRVSLSSSDASYTPHRVSLFAYASGDDPYQLAPAAYTAAFAANSYYGRLRWQKPYPDVFRSIGWCSWNTYYDTVSEEKVVNSVRSLREHNIPLGFVLVDEGWRTANGQKLAGYDAEPSKFPHGLAGLAKTLHEIYHVPYVGVWHVFQGYWQGVDPDSAIGRSHKLFAGKDGQYLPDPRNRAGESFYADWYSFLKSAGIDFIKVDNQASNPKFTDGLLPLFSSGSGEQQNVQEAASQSMSSETDQMAGNRCVNMISCMEMSLENAFNWRYSNIARNSEDYNPDSRADTKDHVFWNAYNAIWTANFAFPDWDMFETQHEDGEYQAIARAISGGPIYTTDSPGKEHPEHLLPLAFSNGRLLMLDGPGMVTSDLLLRDPSLEPVPLKVFGTITRPGLTAAMVAVFNVNKSAKTVSGVVRTQDARGLVEPTQPARAEGAIAVYRRSAGTVSILNSKQSELAINLSEFGHDLFTLVPVDQGVAVFGSLDKYLGPAALVSVERKGASIVVSLQEPGDFGAYLARMPHAVKVDGKTLPSHSFTYSRGLLRIPKESFDKGSSDHRVQLVLAK